MAAPISFGTRPVKVLESDVESDVDFDKLFDDEVEEDEEVETVSIGVPLMMDGFVDLVAAEVSVGESVDEDEEVDDPVLDRDVSGTP